MSDMQERKSGSLTPFVSETKRVIVQFADETQHGLHALNSKGGDLSCHNLYTWVYCVNTSKCCQSLS